DLADRIPDRQRERQRHLLRSRHPLLVRAERRLRCHRCLQPALAVPADVRQAARPLGLLRAPAPVANHHEAPALPGLQRRSPPPTLEPPARSRRRYGCSRPPGRGLTGSHRDHCAVVSPAIGIWACRLAWITASSTLSIW